MGTGVAHYKDRVQGRPPGAGGWRASHHVGSLHHPGPHTGPAEDSRTSSKFRGNQGVLIHHFIL